MAALKLSKNDITFNNGNNNDENNNKIKLNKNQVSFNSAMFSTWETSSKNAVNIINSYNEKLKNNEYLSSDDIASYRKAIDTYISNTNNLRGVNKVIGSGYSDEEEKGWTDTVTSLNSGYDSISNYYSNFDSEDAYNSYIKKAEDQKKHQVVLSAEDFEEYSKLGVDKGKEKEFKWATTENGQLELFSNVHNSLVVAYREDPNLYMEYSNLVSGQIYGEEALRFAQYMTDDEYGIYTYYLGKDNDLANEYLKSIEDTINQRQAGKIVENIGDSGLLKGIFSVAAGLNQWVSGVENLDNFFTGEEADTTSAMQYASGAIREGIESDFWRTAYDLGVTVSNQLPSILVGSLTGSVGGLATMGVSVLGNSYAEMRNLGYNEWQSRGYATLVTAAELGLQSAMGGLSSLAGSKSLSKVALKAIDSVDNAIVRAALQLGASAFSEGAEEAAQSVLEPIFKAIVSGEWENLNIDWGEVAYSGLLGALSAGAIEGTGAGINTVVGSITAKNLYGENQQDLIESGLEFGEGTAQYNLAKKYQSKLDKGNLLSSNLDGKSTIGRKSSGKGLSGFQLYNLSQTIEKGYKSEDTGKIQTATEARFKELGETANTSELAEAITKKITGESLSLKEKSLLKKSQHSQSVLKDLKGETTSDWVQGIGTERINSELYNLAEETATLSDPFKKNIISSGDDEEEKEKPTTTMAVSDDGKTKLIETQEEVKIKEIASIKNGEVFVRLENGNTVNVNEIEFGSTNEGLVYEAVADMSVESANEMVKGYVYSVVPFNNPQMSIGEYVHGFKDAHKYGYYGFPDTELGKGVFTSGLSEQQRKIAYNRGKLDAMSDAQANKKETVSQKETVGKKKGKVIFDKGLDGKTLHAKNRIQKTSIKALKVIADALGVDIHIFESQIGKNGERIGENGYYDPKDKSIHIDLYAGRDGKSTILFTAAHELTHLIRDISPEKFKIFADFLLEQYGKKGVSIDALVQAQIAKAKANGIELDYDAAYEEVIADACERMLVDSNAVEKLAMLKAKDRGLFDKIKEFITNLIAKIKQIYSKLTPDSTEARLVSELKDTEELLSKWVDALMDVAENGLTSTEATLIDNGIMVNSNTDSASLYSVRDLLDSKQQKKVAESLASRFGVTEQEAKDWIKAETSLASIILNPKYSQYLDYTADSNEVAIKTNSDYPQGTVDFSNICKKRRDFTDVMNRVLRKFPNHVFEAADLAKIRTIMSEEGMEVACGICYVEDRRQLDSIVAQDFINSLDLYRNGSKTRPDGNPFNANQLKALSLIDGDTYTPSIYELISLEGRNALKAKNPAMEEAWVKFNNARGMQSVRLLLNDAEYKRQILKYSDATVTRKNNLGGLRIYSFSDMEMFHLIDIVQVITDSAAVGLSLQGYTKVNEYAKAVKDTGEKLNRSLIPKGELGYHIENGKVVLDYDTVEGIDVNHPDFFDNIDNPNIGNIVIGINSTQIKAAMTSKFIDQIIPFHTGQSNEVLGEKGIATWVNYKDFQSERDSKTKKKSAHQINIYTEVIEAAEKEGKPIKNKVDFVNKFLEVCKKNNLIPRFSDFLDVNENGDFIYTEGYHKFLVDFKTFDQNTGEYLPQMPVKPIFDSEYLTSLLKDYVKTQQVKDAQLSATIPTVLDRITKEIIKPDIKHSWRNVDKIQGLEDYSVEEVSDIVKDHIKNIAEYYGEDVEIIDVRPYGSRAKGTAKKKSDLDIVVQYEGDIREDDMFNMLNDEDQLVIDGIEVDINPIKADDTGTIEEYLDRVYGFDKYNEKKFSTRDSQGNTLTPEQQEFFKDSKVRDENGNLLVVYHGTETGGFTVFGNSRSGGGYWFADKTTAESYIDVSLIGEEDWTGGLTSLYSVYLNAKKPLVVDAKGYRAAYMPTDDIPQINGGKFEHIDNIAVYAKENGYDGLIVKNVKDYGMYTEENLGEAYDYNLPEGTVYVVFNSNQIKSTSNKNPTSNPDIRYSTRDYKDHELVKAVVQTITDIKKDGGKWFSSNNTIENLFNSHPEYNYLKRLNDGDATAKAELNELLSSIDDYGVLDNLHHFPVAAMYKYKKAWSKGIRSYQLTVKKRMNEVLDQIEWKYYNEGTEKGRDLGLKDKEQYTLQYIEDLFYQLNSDKTNAVLAKKVFAISKNLGLDIRALNRIDNERGTHGSSAGHKLALKAGYFNGITVSDQSKANTILHELIHSCTSYAIYLNQNGYSHKLSFDMQLAVSTLNRVYEQVKNDPDFNNSYGQKSVYEMVAELSKEDFRNNLKKKNLWQRIIDAIKKLFGFETKTLYDGVYESLNYLLDNFDQYAYNYYTTEFTNNAFWEKADSQKYSTRDVSVTDFTSIDEWFESLSFEEFNELINTDTSVEDISEELNVNPKKLEILIRRKGLGKSHIEENRTAVMKQTRIDEAIEDSGAKFNPDYARSYITRISTKDFIDLTVSQDHVDRETFDSEVIGDHGSKMSDYDYNKALQDSQSPYLHIDRTTGRVISHNGRHRIRALEKAGIESVEIEVQLFDEEGYLIKYNANTISDMAISSQFDTAIETQISNIIPLNEAHRAEIEGAYGEKVHTDAGVKYSTRVTDKKTIDFLEKQEHITTYKAMQLIDGKLYPPMAAKVKGADGKYRLTNPSQLGVWQQATEDPSNIKKKKNGVGYYTLNKGNGKSVDAAYNPYEHSSNLVLNDQFEEAYQRDNLVTVECVIPKSEMTSGYRAVYAKDSTGVMDWKAGVVAGKLKNNKRKVYLSRWLKPVRILSEAETAAMYKDIIGTDVSVPFNVVSPALLKELEKVGVQIDYDGSPMYKSIQNRKTENNRETHSFKEYTEKQKENWKDSKRIVLYDNEEQYRSFIREARVNKQYAKKMYFGAITSELASLIKANTGVNVENFNCSLSADEIRKIFKSHGDEKLENLRGQRAITEDDILNIPNVILSPDDIKKSPTLYNGKPVINFTKNIDGRLTVSAVVSDKHLDLFVQTAYAGKKNGNLATPIDEQASINTPKASSGTVSKDIVSQQPDSVNKNIKNSLRDTDGLSTRSLLANALESAAQNEIEKNKLEQYKKKIELIDSESKKLQEIRSELKELFFTKGKRDVERIKQLQADETMTANRITVYDKQLLSLEATKPLKAVLEREKKMAYKRAEQKGKDALAAYREKATETARELMERYQASRRKGIENRNKTKLREDIKTVVKDLNKLLLNPTKDKHIKEELRKPVAEALSVINMDTIGAEERVAKYNDLIAKANDPDMIKELTATRDRIKLWGESLKDKLTALQSAYEKIKNSEDAELVNAYQEPVLNAIKGVVEKVGDTSIRDMTLEQLEAVYEMYSMVLHTVRRANKMFKAKKGETITQTAEKVNEEVRKISKGQFDRVKGTKDIRNAKWTLLKPLVAFRTIGSETFTDMYNEIRNGEDVYYNDINEAKSYIQEQYKLYNYKAWDTKKTWTFKDKAGDEFTLNLEQIMSLYAYSRREQALAHIMEGGIVLKDNVIVKKNKLGIPIKYEVDTTTTFSLTEETLDDICNTLTTEQKHFVENLQGYLSNEMGDKGNEVSMELLGIKLFKEEHYFPLKSSQDYMNFQPQEAGEIKLKNSSFSKETVKHANNPVVLNNFTDIWSEHIHDMSMYHAFVLPLEDFTRVFNYKTKTDAYLKPMSTKETISNAHGDGAVTYIRNFLTSLNGGVRVQNVGIASKMMTLFKKGAVLASASVAIQQPSAVMRAMAYINPIYFVTSTHKSINLFNHKKVWAELKKYAPIAGIKEMGRFDVGMGQDTVEWIKDQKTIMQKADDVLSKAPAFMDEVTWVSIWEAVKKEVAAKNKDLKVDSEEFLKKCGERFSEVISLSQVYDSVFSRSDIMRNKSDTAKALTAFMAEPTTTLNMLWDSMVQGKRTGSVKGFLGKTAATSGAILGSIVLNSLLKSIITAMRDDDDEESYLEKYVEALIGNTKDNLNPLTYIPFVKDIVSIFEGYDVERMDMALFSDLQQALDAMDSEEKTEYEKWTGLIGAISAFAGVPFKNVERDIRGAYNTIKSFIEGEKTTEAGIENAIKEGWTGKETSNTQQLYAAYISGDKEQIKRVESRFADKSEIESALRKALRENDPRIKEAAQAVIDGNPSERVRITKEIIAEGHFTSSIVIGAINAELTYIKKKLNEAKETN